MKTLKINVAGKIFNAEVEMIEDDEPIIPADTPYYDPTQIGAGVSANISKGTLVPIHSTKKVIDTGSAKVMTSPINGTVLEVLVMPGDAVEENEPLFIFEAMKMKTNVCAPHGGKVKKIHIRVGEKVDSNSIILTFE